MPIILNQKCRANSIKHCHLDHRDLGNRSRFSIEKKQIRKQDCRQEVRRVLEFMHMRRNRTERKPLINKSEAKDTVIGQFKLLDRGAYEKYKSSLNIFGSLTVQKSS